MLRSSDLPSDCFPQGVSPVLIQKRVSVAAKDDTHIVIFHSKNRSVNYIDEQFLKEFSNALDCLQTCICNTYVTAVVFGTSKQDSWIAGSYPLVNPGCNPSHYSSWAERVSSAFDEVSSLPVLTVAAVSGHVEGLGLELAAACDFVVSWSRAPGFFVPPSFYNSTFLAGGYYRVGCKITPNVLSQILAAGTPRPLADVEGFVDHSLEAGNGLPDFNSSVVSWVQRAVSRRDKKPVRFSLPLTEAPSAYEQKMTSDSYAEWCEGSPYPTASRLSALACIKASSLGEMNKISKNERDVFVAVNSDESFLPSGRLAAGISAVSGPSPCRQEAPLNVVVVSLPPPAIALVACLIMADYIVTVVDDMPEAEVQKLVGTTLEGFGAQASDMTLLMTVRNDLPEEGQIDAVFDCSLGDGKLVLRSCESNRHTRASIAHIIMCRPDQVLDTEDLCNSARFPERVTSFRWWPSRYPYQPDVFEISHPKSNKEAADFTSSIFNKIGRSGSRGGIVLPAHKNANAGLELIKPILSKLAELLSKGVSVNEITQAATNSGWQVCPLVFFDMFGVQSVHKMLGDHDYKWLSSLSDSPNTKSFFSQDIVNPDLDAALPAPSSPLNEQEIAQQLILTSMNSASSLLACGIFSKSIHADVLAVVAFGFNHVTGGPLQAAHLIGLSQVIADMEKEHITPDPFIVSRSKEEKSFYALLSKVEQETSPKKDEKLEHMEEHIAASVVNELTKDLVPMEEPNPNAEEVEFNLTPEVPFIQEVIYSPITAFAIMIIGCALIMYFGMIFAVYPEMGREAIKQWGEISSDMFSQFLL